MDSWNNKLNQLRVDCEETKAISKVLRANSAELVRKTRENCAHLQDLHQDIRNSRFVRQNPHVVKAAIGDQHVVKELTYILGEEDADGVADALISMYQVAVARDDDQMEHALRPLLYVIGRYLAAQLEPKAAGVVLS